MLSIKNLPDGATYSLEEVTITSYYSTPSSLFDVSYEGEAGTIEGKDVEAVVTNVLKTVDLKLSKEVYGYDDGRVFYITYDASQNPYESYDLEFTDRDGVVRHFFHKTGSQRMYGIVPIRPEDGVVTIKLPVQTAYYIRENVPKIGKEIPSYEELMAYMADGHSSLSDYNNDEIVFGSAHDWYPTGYYESGLHGADQSGTMQYSGLDLKYVNASRMLNISKVDESGKPGCRSTYAAGISSRWSTF